MPEFQEMSTHEMLSRMDQAVAVERDLFVDALEDPKHVDMVSLILKAVEEPANGNLAHQLSDADLVDLFERKAKYLGASIMFCWLLENELNPREQQENKSPND